MSKYTVEVQATRVQWYPSTPNEYAQLDTEYSFFDSEQEAARAFLEEVAEHPEARYHHSQYEDAKIALT